MNMTCTVQLPIVIEQFSNKHDSIYSHDLQLYQNAPVGEITLDELQEISQTRLKGYFPYFHIYYYFLWLLYQYLSCIVMCNCLLQFFLW